MFGRNLEMGEHYIDHLEKINAARLEKISELKNLLTSAFPYVSLYGKSTRIKTKLMQDMMEALT